MAKLETWANAAWDWSERQDVPVEIWRDEQGCWQATVKLKDSRGWFSGTVAGPGGMVRWPSKDEEITDRVSRELSKICQKMRENRIKASTGRSPVARAA